MLRIYPVFILLIVFLLSGCGASTEVTTVTDRARTLDPGERPERETDAAQTFRLNIGEVRKIQSMDPLYAHHPSAQRLIAFLYDGLTRLDGNGNAKPALAESWEVSDDSLTYTFKLRDDAFFHDDAAFSSGRGRHVTGEDVKKVFKRMASYEIPPQAAMLFAEHIAGFEAFFVQERNTYFDEDILYSDIRGIEAEDERTVKFTLNRPYSGFPELLASPYASIYPSEVFSARTTGLHASPVGTGPFVFSSLSSDTLITLEKNFSYFDKSRVSEQLTSIELHYFDRESELFSALSTGRVDFIPQLGPQISKTVLESNSDELAPGYQDDYRLLPSTSHKFSLYFIADNFKDISRDDAASILSMMNTEEATNELPGNLEISHSEEWEELTARDIALAEVDGKFRIGSTNEPFARYIASVFAGVLTDSHDPELHFMSLPHRDLVFFWSDLPVALAHSYETVSEYTVNNFALTRDNISGIMFNDRLWWLNLENVRKETPDDPS